MRIRARRMVVSFLGAVFLCIVAGAASGDVVSDQGAAILIWPDVVAIGDDAIGAIGVDTIVQLTNTSSEPISAHCFYENANYHCRDTGDVCVFAQQCCSDDGCSICEPGWIETDFRVRLTPRQPIGWSALDGMGRDDVPLSGAAGETGIGGSSNAGMNIPPLSERIYNGSLRCVATNTDGSPSDRNVLIGESTRVQSIMGRIATVAKHNAIGVKAIEGAVNEDRELVLGGGDAEYEGCPEVLIVNHLFDGVEDPIAGDAIGLRDGDGDDDDDEELAVTSGFGGPRIGVGTRLTLVPCTQDWLRQIPGRAVVQYLVYNEFEQRFSTSRSVDCKFESFLSSIDTTDRNRSIFSAGVSGTVVGQSRLRSIGSGLVGVAAEFRGRLADGATASGGLTNIIKVVGGGSPVFSLIEGLFGDSSDFNIHQQGDRSEADVMTLP